MSGLSTLCCKPGPVLNRAPEGKIETINGVSCYVVGPVDQPNTQAIIYSTDIFGHTYEHNQKNADYLASQGYVVYVPDMFNGGAISEPAEFCKRGRDWFMTEWMPKYPAEESAKLLRSFTESVKSKHSVLYATGYCYGVYGLWHLSQDKLFAAQALAHPSFLKSEDADLYAVPSVFLCAEVDHSFNPEIRAHFEQTLKGKDAVFIDFPRTEHGFVARGDESVQEQRQKALEETVNFFKKHQPTA